MARGLRLRMAGSEESGYTFLAVSSILPEYRSSLFASPLLSCRRSQVGQASMDHIPRELRIMGRTILTQKGVARWYDLPLTEEEIVRGHAVGECGYVLLKTLACLELWL